eukprot:SAG31_NODE_26422_length_442_cov_1.483965_2_plen_37_part_01
MLSSYHAPRFRWLPVLGRALLARTCIFLAVAGESQRL